MQAKGGDVYIISNKTRSVLYIGVTSDLYSRVYQHKNGYGSVFTEKYKCTDLVYYQFYESIESAIDREKKMKKWNRAWKNKMISDFNPEWLDLFNDVEEMN